MATSIDLDFANGSYTFALPLAQINALQNETGIGIGGLFARVIKGANRLGEDVVLAPADAQFYAGDLFHTIRLGLIGGATGVVDGANVAVTPNLAMRLMNDYVYGRPLSDAWSLAVSILGATIVGYEPEGGKKKAPLPDSSPEAEPTAG